jgi:glycosyltransferase involved in cell wall biosynthesis
MLYVGRLSPEKEVNLIINAYQRMPKNTEQPVKLVIVGDGPDRERLEAMNAQGDIIFTGSLSGTALAQAYASADVFAFASQVETFGNVVLEAMASGLPVIAYDYACARLHLKPNETGWLSPLGQPEDLVGHIHRLPDLTTLRQMGEHARKATLNIGWQYPVQQFEQALYLVAKELHMPS